MATGSGRDELRTRERALRRAYRIVADPDRSYTRQIDALLEVVREAVGTDYATLSRVHEDAGEYIFERVAVPDDVDLRAGETAPLADLPNCARVVETEGTLILRDVGAQAPELAHPEWGISCYLGTPVFVEGDVYGTFCFYDMGARTEEFSDWDVTFVELLGSWVGYELERQRRIDRLTALNELSRVVHEVADAAAGQSTREGIETAACRTLADVDSYLFAWIGEADPATGEVAVRTEAGAGVSPDGVAPVDPDRERRSPSVRGALRTREVRTRRTVRADSTDAPRRDDAAHGYLSSIHAPVLHADTVYGVLSVYADRIDGFGDGERSVVEHLGERLGHAIASVERKRALASDTVIELEFRVRDALADPEGPGPPDETIVFDELVWTDDDEFTVYGTTSEAGMAALADLGDRSPRWNAVTRMGERDDGVAFEARLSGIPLLSTVASSEGTMERMVVEAGHVRTTMYLPPDVDARRIVESVRGASPDSDVVSKREMVRPDDPPGRTGRALTDDLTDRQLETLRTAYFAGYFERPRDASGGEVADRLGISDATFSQHLRVAENKLFAALFGDSPDG